jgi:hypothetical protein
MSGPEPVEPEPEPEVKGITPVVLAGHKEFIQIAEAYDSAHRLVLRAAGRRATT